MNKETLEKVKSVVIYVVGLAMVVIGAIPESSVSPGVHAVLAAVGGILIGVERYLQQNGAVAIMRAKQADPAKIIQPEVKS